MMTLLNDISDVARITHAELRTLLILLNRWRPTLQRKCG